MLELATISLTVFSYVTEENNRVVTALHNSLDPENRKEKLTKIKSNSQFGDPLVIYSFETDNADQISTILHHLGNKLPDTSKEYLTNNLVKKLDFDQRSVYIRLNKYKAYEDELVITEGSDVIRVEIAYNAYTKKQNSLENVEELLRHYKLIN